jgi:hypothetical protein
VIRAQNTNQNRRRILAIDAAVMASSTLLSPYKTFQRTISEP